jgi:hypothetical protein
MFKKLTVLVLSCLIAIQMWAEKPQDWGATGHRVVGEIADDYLSCRAKRKIKKILGTESVAISSNWADFIKSDNTLRHLDPWHYLNIDSGIRYDDFMRFLQTDTSTNAFTKINFLTNELKTNKSLDVMQKRFYLRMLVHLVGDVHQPMHAGRKSDLGGNLVKVMWFNEPSNLHSVWDDKIIEMQKLSYSEYTANINHTTKRQCREWQQQPLSMWIWESYEWAGKIYAYIKQPDQKLSYRYNFDYIEIVNERLLKGGVRLAGLLNDIFG